MLNNEDDMDQREYEGRVVTDSVHERFQQTRIYCNICNRDIIGNEAAIRKHFNDIHPSSKHCCYCKGKVFTYQKITTIDDKEHSEDFVYHKCLHNKELENKVSKESK
ncbi:hypothetical protein PUN28_007254 [Cardiocondyla obscurior]|uniref:C2H2-type domain-containing protein n=1 Tax=Cardiocondyla obscurior TaxID=286306 RepID=A0AAW2G8M4_9HYME